MIGFARGTANKPSKEPDKCVLYFDSGDGVTFEDARHHILALGTTGSGKTASVVLPTLSRLIQGGHPGIVIDIKGNLLEQAYILAQQHGRGDDLVELGSSSSATPLNLLCGMDIAAVRELLKTFIRQQGFLSGYNKDWHVKGAYQACDCAQLLRYLTALNTAFEPTLQLINIMLNDFVLTSRLFGIFKEAVFDEGNKEQRMFLQQIQSNKFHIFHFDAEKGSGKENATYNEQLTWNLQAIRMALADFIDAPGIARGFASHGAAGLDMQSLLAQKKIVLLRFGPDTGPIGATLSRLLLEAYYKAVYATGLHMPQGEYTFACLDEFQDFADLGDGRFSDVNFTSQAREFRSIFLASTQSMSALANRGNSLAGVNALISNCNTRIIFYSDDPFTQSMTTMYDASVLLNVLQAGEAFIVRYDTEKRQHSFGIETLQQSFETTHGMLQEAGFVGGNKPESDQGTQAATQDTVLHDILAEYEKAKEDAICAKVHAEAAIMMQMYGENKMRAEDKKKQDTSVPLQTTWLDGMDQVMPKIAEQVVGNLEFGQRIGTELRRKYPQLFPEERRVFVSLPPGWVSYLEKALEAFSTSGLGISIEHIANDKGTLKVRTAKGGDKNLSEHIMNALLEGTSKLCSLCGEFAHPSYRHEIFVCEACLRKFGLSRPEADEHLAERSAYQD